MEILVDLHLAVFGLLIALAVISSLVHLALRAGSALAWLAATMVCVGTETLIFRYAAQTNLGIAAISLLVPFAYLCAANSIRQSLHLPVTDKRQIVIFSALIGFSLALLASGAPIFYQCIPFQLAGVYVFYGAIRKQMLRQQRSHIDQMLLFLSFASMIGVAIRAPMFPLLLGHPTPYPVMDISVFNDIFINSLSLLTAGLAVLLIAKIVANEIDKLKHQAERDDLTGLLNRRIFDEVARGVDGSTGAVIMCDIDHFKSVNDLYGHHIGDEVIQSFACILSHSGDYVGRCGGEEFSILLVGSSMDEAINVAEAIRSDFHQFRHNTIGEHIAFSASFGVADYGPECTIKDAFRRADKALYHAKESGRNRVCRGDAENVFEREIVRTRAA